MIKCVKEFVIGMIDVILYNLSKMPVLDWIF